MALYSTPSLLSIDGLKWQKCAELNEKREREKERIFHGEKCEQKITQSNRNEKLLLVLLCLCAHFSLCAHYLNSENHIVSTD